MLFPALRSYLWTKIGDLFSRDAFRTVAGSAVMALLVWGGIVLVGEARSLAMDAWRASDAFVKAARKEMRTWIGRQDAVSPVDASAACTSWTRRPMTAGTAHVGDMALTIGDAVRGCDEALVRTVRNAGLSVGHTWLLQKESRWVDHAETTEFFFQRIVVYGVGAPEAFAGALRRNLGVHAEDVTVRFVSRDGRRVIRLSYGDVAGVHGGCVTHEIFLMQGVSGPMADGGGSGPRLGVVVTGLGSDVRSIGRLARLKCPLTVAVVPHRRESSEIVGRASEHGFDVLIQQPMESTGAAGSIRMDMGPDQSRGIIRANVVRYPQACGLMNYDGDVITASRKACMPLVEEAARCGLLVVDAMNHPAGELAATARRIGLASWRRTLSADGSTVEACLMRLRRAERHAKTHGYCIVTVQATDTALTALERWVAERDPSVTLVSVRRQRR